MEVVITHMGKRDTGRININSSQVLGRVEVKEWIQGTDGIIMTKIIDNMQVITRIKAKVGHRHHHHLNITRDQKHRLDN